MFVADKNRLANAPDFQSGTNSILKASRIMVIFQAVGSSIGSYEAALKYCLERHQFGKPIAQFQLVQERLSRMLATCEAMLLRAVDIAVEFDKDNGQTVTIG